MAISTPRGFLVRLPPEYAFALLARLSPHITAFDALQRVEAIHHIRGMFVYLAALCSVLIAEKPVIIPLAMLFASIFSLEIQFTKNHPAILISIGRIWSLVTGFFVLTLAIAALVYLKFGWHGVIFLFLGRIGAEGLFYAFDLYYVMRMKKLIGFGLPAIERYFLLSYKALAEKHGVDSSTKIKANEIQSGAWKVLLEDFETKWPMIKKRFITPLKGSNQEALYQKINFNGVPDIFSEDSRLK